MQAARDPDSIIQRGTGIVTTDPRADGRASFLNWGAQYSLFQFHLCPLHPTFKLLNTLFFAVFPTV